MIYIDELAFDELIFDELTFDESLMNLQNDDSFSAMINDLKVI